LDKRKLDDEQEKNMAELKTKPNDQSVEAFINHIENESKRQDSWTILKILQEASGEVPQMWGDSIVGFGTYHYHYASGREGNWFLTGFSPRKRELTLYIMSGFDQYDELLVKLGKYKTGVSCLYIKKLEDIDSDILKKLVTRSVEQMRRS
jgi:hypothetical protein